MTGTELEKVTAQGEIVRDLRNPQTDSWTAVLEDVALLAQRIADTAFVPESFRGNVPAVAATILYGREVGLGPMQALTTLHNIKGRVGMYAETMRALVLQAGHEIVIVESSGARVTVKGRRAGSQEWSTVTWTIDAARQAKLGGDNWTKYPRAMLAARATAELCRLVFADAIHGLAAVEELEELTDTVHVGPAGALPAGGGGTKVQRRRKAPEPEPAQPEPARPAPPLPDPPPPAPGPGNGAEPPLDEPAEVAPTREPISTQQRALLMAKFTELDVTDRAERLYVAGCLAGRKIDSTNELSKVDASHVIDALASVRSREDLEQLLAIAGEPK